MEMYGLILYYNEKAYAGVVSDGKRFYIYRNAEHKTELPNRIGKHFFARLHNCGNRLSVEVSKDGEEWTVLASDMDVSSLHHNNYGGFMLCVLVCFPLEKEVRVSAASVIGMQFRERKI